MHTWLAGLIVVTVGACSPGITGSGAGPQRVSSDGHTEVRFDASDDALLNPERGLFTIGDLVSGFDFTEVRERGSTVSYVLVRLDEFRTQPLTYDFLTQLERGFGLARAAGVKILLRFAYNFDAGGADAPRDVILNHLNQLSPVLHRNADVIAAVEAGLIGAWGEWHSSTNGLENVADRRDIVDGLLAAIPSSRAVMVRTPMYKRDLSAAGLARIGHHNDCFLASDSDLGTYASPVDEWKRAVAEDGLTVPVGGETCQPAPPRSDCASALAELDALHWSLMSRGGSREVWQEWADGGCTAEIERRLGYRFRFVRAIHDDVVAPGGTLTLELQVKNDGFAAPYNERPVFVVLAGGGVRVALPVDQDPRRWRPGEETRFTARVTVPDDLVPGEYHLGLWLPDAAPTLQARPDFAIRFANPEVWDEATGTNLIGTIMIEP